MNEVRPARRAVETTTALASTDPLSSWFLTADERGNPATMFDRARDGIAWTTGNVVVPIAHGRHYYQSLYDELIRTRPNDVVLFTDWRGDPDELLAGPGTAVADVLAATAARGVQVNGLLWRSHPDRTRFSEEENRGLAADINAAGGEVLLDERVRRAGSHHQKMFVLLHPDDPDRDVAFVGGIDLCHGRNDDELHRGDPQVVSMDRRFGPTPAWHDIQAEIRGRAVADIAQTFCERWNDPHPLTGRLLARRGTERGPRQGRLQVQMSPPTRPAAGTHAVQVLRTYPAKRPSYPFAPTGERSIARAYLKAFRRARRLIYIEDQYLWSSDVAHALGQALRDRPRLRIAVVVPRYPDEDGWLTGPPNRIGQVDTVRHLRQAGGQRFAIYNLENEQFPIYVHAKICIIDDVWMTIGSDNLNRRSWTHDSELSCAILDETRDLREPADPGGLGDIARVLARSTRLELWSEHLQSDDVPVDPDEGFERLRSSADRLDRWHESGESGPRPPGRLRHHLPQPVSPIQRIGASVMYRLVNDPDGRPISLRRRQSF
jgi:phosphatidylserine/phosphatidylglycerophosphate/cardiolipin synthase-like enzyme